MLIGTQLSAFPVKRIIPLPPPLAFSASHSSSGGSLPSCLSKPLLLSFFIDSVLLSPPTTSIILPYSLLPPSSFSPPVPNPRLFFHWPMSIHSSKITLGVSHPLGNLTWKIPLCDVSWLSPLKSDGGTQSH